MVCVWGCRGNAFFFAHAAGFFPSLPIAPTPTGGGGREEEEEEKEEEEEECPLQQEAGLA